MSLDSVEPTKPTVRPTSSKHMTLLKRELETMLERYELVWQATNDVLYDLHIETGQVIWNDALRRQFGYAKHELVGTLEWWIARIHPDDALRVEDGLATWFSSGKDTWRTEYRFRKANGSYNYVMDRGFLLRGKAGEPVRIIGTLQDITDQKRLERAKDEFISLVSHQLRTPLTVIRVYGDMFAEGLLGKLTPVQAEHIARMTDASVRLIKLVDDILNVSRIELGSFEIKSSWVRASEIVGYAVDQARTLATAKGVTITFTAATTADLVYADADILGQVIENLLSNAVRYTPGGTGVIKVSCEPTTTELIITVSDNGIGIPKAEQKRVFDRFYRAHNAVNIEEHGTGLGLYLVRILVQLLGGRVWFDSDIKHGTTFYVALPKS